MDEAALREIVRAETREAVREVIGETLLRALGVLPEPEPDPLWSLSVPELVEQINAADADGLARIRASEANRPEGPRPGVMAVCDHRQEELAA